MKNLHLHLLLCFFVLIFYHLGDVSWLVKWIPRNSPPKIIQTMAKNLSLDSKENKGFVLALIYGMGQQLDSKTKIQIRELGLNHAITPSGLHLALLHPLINIIPWTLPVVLIYFILFLFISSADYYFALSRCVLFYLLKHLCKIIKFPIGDIPLFYLTFLIDLIFGSYSKSPLSYIYSFIFWGTIVFLKDQTFLKKITYLFICYSMVSFFQVQNISLLYLITNPAMSMFLSISFMLISIFLILQFPMMVNLLASLNLKLICIIHNLVSVFPMIGAGSILIFFIVLYFKKKRILTAIVIFLMSNPLNQGIEKLKYNLHQKNIYRAF